MELIKHPLSFYVDLLKARTPFAFSRWGDGEILTAFGGQYIGRRNSNGCTFTQSLSDDLRDVLRANQPYYHGLLLVARSKRAAEIATLCAEQKIRIEWVDGDVLLNAMLRGRLWPLIEQVRQYRILYVGNERLRGLNGRGLGFFDYTVYVQPPSQNAHTVKDQLLDLIWQNVEKHGINFIGWSSGLATKVMLDATFVRFPNVTQIDFGSSFDGYFPPMPNVKPGGSRSYIRVNKLDWKDLLAKNTGKGSE